MRDPFAACMHALMQGVQHMGSHNTQSAITTAGPVQPWAVTTAARPHYFTSPIYKSELTKPLNAMVITIRMKVAMMMTITAMIIVIYTMMMMMMLFVVIYPSCDATTIQQ